MAERRKGVVAAAVVVGLLVIDQVVKIWVKTHMALYDTIEITSWFKIHFVENIGMAYGMQLVPKLGLSLFRLVAIVALLYYVRLQLKKNARMIYIVLLAMLTAGAAGNMLDSMFYGLVFSGSSPNYVSYVVPFGSGYAPFLMGRVVDMFYFPLFTTTLPEWWPVGGGEPYTFFSPIFNFADACITVSMFLLLLFCRKELSELSFKESKPEVTPEADEENE